MKKLFFISILLVLLPFAGYAQDGWTVRAEKIDRAAYYGVGVANGMVGVVSSAEPLKVGETVLAGVYDHYGRGRTSNLLPQFNLLDMDLSLGWETVTAANISNFSQTLDMHTGTFTGRFDFKDVASVEYAYRALRQLPHCLMMDLTVTPKEDTYLVAENRMKAPSAFRDVQMSYNEVNTPDVFVPLLTTVAKSPTGKIEIAASTTFLFPEKHGSEPRVMHEIRDGDAHLMKFVKALQKGRSYTFSLVGTLISSRQTTDPYNQAERLSVYAHLQGREDLLSKHREEWQKLWVSDILIEGNPQAQQDVRLMLYHLYSSVRDDADLSIPPMGLSGTGYNGHVFWDAEMFMFSPLLILQPQLAKTLVEYRFNRLRAAQDNARLHGYPGAMYPWESAATGEEETPLWALSGTHEQHITGDVAFAAWHYFLATQDTVWLREKGWPILKNTADFWVGRATSENGKYAIRNVVAADEWAENIDNDAYTNAVAQLNLRFAAACARCLHLPVRGEWEQVAQGLSFSKMADGVTREYDGYDGKNIKQADVNLLAYPLKIITDKNQIKKDLDYYVSKVSEMGTPAMTQAVFALLYSRLGDAVRAGEHFDAAYKPNQLPPFGVLAETKGGTNPYFVTGAGGVLQAVLMGFAGIDLQTNGTIAQLKTALPPTWKKLTVTGVGKEKRTITVSRINE